MKISIRLEYKEKVFTSDYTDLTEKEIEELEVVIQKLVEGKLSHFSMKRDNQTFYFGRTILMESILTITSDK